MALKSLYGDGIVTARLGLSASRGSAHREGSRTVVGLGRGNAVQEEARKPLAQIGGRSDARACTRHLHLHSVRPRVHGNDAIVRVNTKELDPGPRPLCFERNEKKDRMQHRDQNLGSKPEKCACGKLLFEQISESFPSAQTAPPRPAGQ